jgi:DUF4097 and DUF4098 domain-containing protein YvlB
MRKRRSQMKTQRVVASLGVLLFMTFLMTAAPAELIGKEKFEEKFQKTVPLAQDGKVVLTNISGDVEVKTWDKGEVKIDALKVSKASSLEKAKENAGQVTIEVNKENSVLRIETKYPKNKIKNLDVSVDFALMIPSQATMNAKSVSGDVTFEGIGGKAEAKSVSGDISVFKAGKGAHCESVSGDLTVADVAGGLNGKSVSGDLEVANITGDTELHTVSGDVKVESVKGSVEAESVSGDVTLMGVSEADEVKGKTLSGDIKYQGMIKPDGKYSLASHSGDATMIIPGDSAFDLEAKTFSGDIDSAFEIAVSGKLSKKEIRGSVNGGGADVTLKTFSGDVQLKKK